jgi:hypothetical protein
MIPTARLYRCLVLLLRALPRPGDPLSPPQPMPRTLPQNDAADRAESDTSDRYTLVMLLRPRRLTGDPGPGQTASWVKSP